MRILAFTMVASLFTFNVCFATATAQTPRPRSAPQFRCPNARLLLRQAEAAQTASDDARVLHLFQQAIEAYELCDNPTYDDSARETTAMLAAGAYLYDKGNLNAARQLYVDASVKLSTLCTQTGAMNSGTGLRAHMNTLTHREIAEPIGLVPIEACDEAFPRPTSTP
jgi:hypothetical protein